MLEGFELWVPPTVPNYADEMPYYEILGTDAQIVQFPVRAGRQIMCFSGAMAYMSEGMKIDCKLAGIGKMIGRLAGGGSLFQITYTNERPEDGYIGLTPDYPGVIVPINMSATGKVIALRDSFLCATVGIGDNMTDVGAGFNPTTSPVSCLCNGMDFIVQTVESGEWAFLMAMGTVIKKTLNQGETILVDGKSILCFESSVTIDVRPVGGMAAMCCGGEGIFNTELTGPGTIHLQSMSIDKLRLLFPPNVNEPSNNSGGDGGGGDGGFGDGGGGGGE